MLTKITTWRWLRLTLLFLAAMMALLLMRNFPGPHPAPSSSFPLSLPSDTFSSLNLRDAPQVKATSERDKSHSAAVATLSVGPDVSPDTFDVETDVSGQYPPASLPSCPPEPPDLVGLQDPEEVATPMETLEEEWKNVLEIGGHYRPPHCLPENRTAIIIPCRNRWTHLRILLSHLIPFLIRQELSFTLFVVESDAASHFNKAILLNAGFLEALKRGNYTCFVFHDVDLLPLNDRNLYRCGDQPRHLAAAIDKHRYRLPYTHYFGGVLALTAEMVKKVNGHSNLHFGWGGEDDDMELRLLAKGYRIHRLPVSVTRYHMIRHRRDKGNEVAILWTHIRDQKEVAMRMEMDGLRQLQYQKDWIITTPLFTWLRITVNETGVLLNAPRYLQKKVKQGLDSVHRHE